MYGTCFKKLVVVAKIENRRKPLKLIQTIRRPKNTIYKSITNMFRHLRVERFSRFTLSRCQDSTFVGVRILIANPEKYLFRSLYTKEERHPRGVFFLLIASLGTKPTREAQSGSHTAIGGIRRCAWEYAPLALKPTAYHKLSAR